jgi:hypothetical protein
VRLKRYGSSRLVACCASALLTASLVAGCGTGGSGLERDTARQLQARVLEVTQASSQNDPGAALKALEGLETELAAAQQRGDVSEERHRSITTIATAVRADLEDAVDAAKLAAAKTAEEAAAATPSPAPEVPAPAATQPQQENPGQEHGNSGQEQNKDSDKKGEEKGKGKD